jgi:UDP-glucose 4-epimerase
MLPNLGDHISEKITAMEGVQISVSDNCVGCGTCVDTCFVNAIKIEAGRATISDECRGCGRCVEACPENAIVLTVDNDSVEKTYTRISDTVDINGC